jgi:uncharacterized protein (TIGR03083 family)
MSPEPAPLGPIHALGAIVETDAWLIDLLETLSPADWDRPTIVARWHVRHVAGHLLDTALRRLAVVRDGFAAERPASGSPEDVRAFVDRVNAEGVAVYGRFSPVLLVAHMRVAVDALHAHLRQLDPTAPAAFAVSWAGETTSPNWFDVARELTERWHHQQQIRLALDRPGIMTRALYHPVLDCFLRVLPHAYRAVAAAPGTQIDVVVPGASGGVWHLYRAPDRWLLTADAIAVPAAQVTLPEDIAWRVFTKGIPRAEAAAQVAIEGDDALGSRVLDAVAIVG